MNSLATTADDVTRALPHAVGPEKSVLSTILQDPQEFVGIAVESRVTPEHFYLPAHATLYGFILELFETGQEIELVSLIQRLLDRGILERCGGPSAISELYTYAPSGGYFRQHLRMIRDKFVLRSIIQNSNEAIGNAYESPEEVDELLDKTEAAFLAIRNARETLRAISVRETVETCMDALQRQIRGEKGQGGISTGFADLDAMGATLKPCEMFVIAARPSMGKTSFMMNIVEHVCIDQGRKGMVFSVEVSRERLISNLINARAKYASQMISRGIMPTKGDLIRIERAAVEIAKSKLIVDDRGELTIGQLRAAARRHHRESPLEFIAIDYLQLMRSNSKQAVNSREREVAEISAGVKSLAKELQVPIILLAQLNRGPENRTGKNVGKPRMSDLRESGSIEQDADMVGLLYREAYYAQDEEEKQASEGVAELILAKNRNGPTGTIPLTFIAEIMRFETGKPRNDEPPTLGSRY